MRKYILLSITSNYFLYTCKEPLYNCKCLHINAYIAIPERHIRGIVTVTVDITTDGIKSALEKLQFTEKQFFRSIAEYVWNSFDANATLVNINYEFSSNGSLKKIIISDNGTGINFHELKNKFKPFYDSEKMRDYDEKAWDNSDIHGFRGVGRLTFFIIAKKAVWDTVYYDNGKNYSYSIEISSKTLNSYKWTPENPIETTDSTGTTVTLTEFLNYRSFKRASVAEKAMLDYLKREFCWYLELNKQKNKKLIVNGENLNYSDIIEEEREFCIKCGPPHIFNVRYVRWKHQPNLEHSKIYYMDTHGKEVIKENTSLNKQGDKFHNSIFISSNYFNPVIDENGKSVDFDAYSSQFDETYKCLRAEILRFLKSVRMPLLKIQAEEYVTALEVEDHIIDKTNKTDFELIQIGQLETVVKEIFVTEPKIFHNLKKEQKQAIIGLLNLLLSSNERDKIIELIDQIVKLDPKERNDLYNLLQHTELSKIIKTMKLIEDRFTIIALLRKMVFNKELNANEVKHLQTTVENHYWMFGEQYSLVSSSEDDFETALRNHIHILTEKDTTEVVIDHPDKLKQMDIFICRQEKTNNIVRNIIVELKHPEINLGEDQVSQVKLYMRTIQAIPMFNADSYHWDFILVGNRYNTSKYIEGELESHEPIGEPHLIHKQGNLKVYVKKWSDIFNECDIRFKFLNERLEIDKSKLVAEVKTADEGIELVRNSATVIS